ncbi:MAG TPA: T9SS type A sorting domain-containing protein [Ignavibacteriaceae bacterium]|nr:T9SS type A sorting domain-containing protein [Ignavibacteriaceae bacterium]
MRISFLPAFTVVYFLFSLLIMAQNNVEDYVASINGKIVLSTEIEPGVRYSDNRKFKCTYSIGDVTDENRELYKLSFYEYETLLYQLDKIPGAEIEVSNSGVLVAYDHTYHFKGEITLRFYSKTGNMYFIKTFNGANAFQFSESGNSFVLRDRQKIYTYNFITNSEFEYPKGLAYSFDNNDKVIAISDERSLKIYQQGRLIRTINYDIELPRKVLLSINNNLVGVIDKYNLIVYNVTDGAVKFYDKLSGENSFRDLKLVDGSILAGIHTKTKELSKGSIKIFSSTGNIKEIIDGQSRILKKIKPERSELEKRNQYEPIPWPFYPTDTTHIVWNHYEQHMGGGSEYSYLHQGLDIITPIDEPTYAVKGGIVKCVLTLGGALYWRIAISDSNIADYSDGWLYAHLVENTIAFDIGDTVEQYDYLGDIIYWTNEWGHIHFVEIKDSGLVWLYDDNEWGINFNPLLALTPVHDDSPPQIENAFPDSKFGFCINETSTYLLPDSLHGEVDIIVKVFDYIGDSEWQQPAYKINYWIKRVDNGEMILDTTLSHVLNHGYNMYSSSSYEPYATVLYKRDQTFPSPSWMNPVRGYYHIITNNNGDSLISVEDKELALNTADYVDGLYRIFVQAFDPNENFSIDSMDVTFKNGISTVSIDDNGRMISFNLEQNYPNPFNPITQIKYSIPDLGTGLALSVTLKIYDVLGNEVRTLIDEIKPEGSYSIIFDARTLSSGIYFYQLKAGYFVDTKKMILLR